MNVTLLGGTRYFATFVDDKSRYIEVTMLKKRSDEFRAFVKYKTRVEKVTGYKIKKVRTDNAKEYLSLEMTQFLRKEEISRQLSLEYTSQQNGVAERVNHTLVEMARCMKLKYHTACGLKP